MPHRPLLHPFTFTPTLPGDSISLTTLYSLWLIALYKSWLCWPVWVGMGCRLCVRAWGSGFTVRSVPENCHFVGDLSKFAIRCLYSCATPSRFGRFSRFQQHICGDHCFPVPRATALTVSGSQRGIAPALKRGSSTRADEGKCIWRPHGMTGWVSVIVRGQICIACSGVP